VVGDPSATAVRLSPIADRSVWTGAELQGRTDWVSYLSPEQIAELGGAIATALRDGRSYGDMALEGVALPSLAPAAAGWLDEIEDGRGFVLIRGLPVADYTAAEARMAYWLLGLHLGVPTSQNAAGDLVADVRDTGSDYNQPAVRGYTTSAGIKFHTDYSDVVGLLCLQKAKSGGLSSVASVASVYNEMLQQRPDLVGALYQPFYHDWRDEQQPGAKPYDLSPVFAYVEGKLSIRYSPTSIRAAQRFGELPRLTAEQNEALDLINDVANGEGQTLFMDFEQGDVQLLNNYAVLHSRTEFEDYEDPARKRHLLRMWLQLRNGRRLPSGFGRRAGVPPVLSRT
jgi:alpha-ketoglutarate-dependent taurine dioxygenase